MELDYERIASIANNVRVEIPSTYSRLMGEDRLAVLHLLSEPVQSTLHQIMQKKIDCGTKCLYKHCHGVLTKDGSCSTKCEQSIINVVHDIINCENCNCYGFPCPTCYHEIFRKQLPMYVDD